MSNRRAWGPALAAANRRKMIAHEALCDAISLARHEGGSWREIGDALGVSHKTAMRWHDDHRARVKAEWDQALGAGQPRSSPIAAS